MKTDLIHPYILEACRNRGLSDDRIERLTTRELFDHWCEWEGLIGYSYLMYDLVCLLEQRKDK